MGPETATFVGDLVANFGFPIAMVIYLLHLNKQRDKTETEREARREAEALERERRLGARIDEVEDNHRRELVGLIQATTEAIQQTAAVNRELMQTSKNVHKSVSSLVQVMQSAPCRYQRTPSDRFHVDPGILAAATTSPMPPPSEEHYEPHPSNAIVDPGEPPKTPRPMSRREALDENQRRNGGQ